VENIQRTRLRPLRRTPRRGATSLTLVLLLAGATGYAAAADVTVNTHPDFGPYLVDARGHAVYGYVYDSAFTSTCLDECSHVWPPVTFEGIVPTADGVNVTLLGSVARPDGTQQVTLAGIPLYTYVGDEDEGSFRAIGLDDAWFLVAPDGSLIHPDAVATGNDEQADLSDEELVALGRDVFATYCAACHGSQGGGNIGPPLVSNVRLADDAFIVRQIRDGMSEMPGFGPILSSQELAAAASFVRQSFGNQYPIIRPEQFAR
jgi:predicted lipoprotein with Yx(FWY)xxD motif/mono/diheme cytochrome c family protein